MEAVFSPWIWAVITASVALVTSGLSWVLGEAHGFSRAFRMTGMENENGDAFFPLTIPPKLGSETVDASATSALRPLHSAHISELEAMETQDGEASPSQSDTQPLADIRAQAEQIRRNSQVWESPDIGQCIQEFLADADAETVTLFNNFRKSIEQLREVLEESENDPIQPQHLDQSNANPECDLADRGEDPKLRSAPTLSLSPRLLPPYKGRIA